MRKNLKKKISIVIKKVTGSEVTLTHKAERLSNYISCCFTHYLAEQIKKRVICVQIFVRNTP